MSESGRYGPQSDRGDAHQRDAGAPEANRDSSARNANEGVLSRWSRLKRQAGSETAQTATLAKNDALPAINGVSPDSAVNVTLNHDPARLRASVDSEVRSDVTARPRIDGASEARTDALEAKDVATLPSLDAVSLDADFTPFMQAKVPEALRRQALKTLFKDAHFNQMDGLDIYIDDYTKFEPIAPEDLEKLSAWRSIQNPIRQVVTPGGYAVDIESEEGRAVLAAREADAANATNATNAATRDNTTTVPHDAQAEPPHHDAAFAEHERTPDVDASSNESVGSPSHSTQALDSATPAGETRPQPHLRYGKRVGDFRPTAVPEMSSGASRLAEPFDPR